MTTDTAALVQVKATYPWFGDGEPWVWMTSVLEEAKAAGQIVDFEVESARPPLSVTDELMNIKFSVIMKPASGRPRRDSIRYIYNVLNNIVRDTDVEINSIEEFKREESA